MDAAVLEVAVCRAAQELLIFALLLKYIDQAGYGRSSDSSGLF